MANEYITDAEIKAWIGVTGTTYDVQLDIIREAASRMVDSIAGRRFYADGAASARFFTADSPWMVRVDDISTVTGLTVETDSGGGGLFNQTWTLDQRSGYGFVLEPSLVDGRAASRLVAVGGSPFPGGRQAVKVTADWGWPTIPAEVKQATLHIAAAMWTETGQMNTTGGPGIRSIALDGSDTITYQSPAGFAAASSPTVDRLLAAYKRPLIA